MKSIRKKLIVFLGILILVICMGLGSASYILAKKSLISNLEKTLPKIADEAADNMRSKIDGQIGRLESVAARSDISDPNLDTVSKNQILAKEAERLGSITLDFVDAQGNSVAKDGQVHNIGDREYIAKGLKGTSNIAGPDIRKTDGSLSVRYVVPVKNGDTIIGVLLESRDGTALSDYIDEVKFGTTGNAFMINSEGRTIAHKNRESVLDQQNMIEESKKDAKYAELAGIHKKMINNESGIDSYKFNKVEYYVGYCPVEGTNWSLGVIIHSEEILSELIYLRRTALILSVMFIIAGVAIIVALSNSISNGIKAVANHLNLLSHGTLSEEVPEKYLASKDEVGLMTNAMKDMQDSLREMVVNIKDSASNVSDNSESLSSIAEEISSSSQNVTEAITNVAEGTGTQTENIMNITEILNDFGRELSSMVGDIEGVNSSSKEIGDMAQDSNKEMTELNKSIKYISDMFKAFSVKISSLGKNINEINEITNLINEISEQTNLLALNAAIEAARAGEAGKGFAVVAEEIRNLAEQSKDSSEKISGLITDISKETDVIVSDSVDMDNELINQVKTIENTITAFMKIVNGVDSIIPQIDKVKMSAGEIEVKKNVIIDKIDELSAVAEEVAASSEEISASSQQMNATTEEVASSAQSLNNMTDNMMNEVNKFKL